MGLGLRRLVPNTLIREGQIFETPNHRWPMSLGTVRKRQEKGLENTSNFPPTSSEC